MFTNIVYLNRDIDTERKDATEKQLRQINAKATRFSAIESGLEKYSLQSPENLKINKAQLSCLISHLEILRIHGKEDLLVFEDDVDLSMATKWPITMSELISALPDHVGVVQLTYFPSRGTLNPVPWMPGMFSTAAYFIKKEYSEHLVKTGYIDGTWDLTKLKSKYVQRLADSVVYSSTRTMSLLLFGVRGEPSTILPQAIYLQEASVWASNAWDTTPINRDNFIQKIRSFI